MEEVLPLGNTEQEPLTQATYKKWRRWWWWWWWYQ